MKRILFVFVTLFTASVAMAGGTSVPVQMLDLQQTKTDEYVLKFKTLDTKEYEYVYLPRNTVLTVQLRFSSLRYYGDGDFLTIEKYRKALEFLKDKVKEKKVVSFGLMGVGLCKIKGKQYHYESDALDIIAEEDHKTRKTRDVIYSFCRFT